MKHYRVKPSACCTSFAETVLALARDLEYYSNHKNVHYTLLCNCNRPRACQVSKISTHTKSLADHDYIKWFVKLSMDKRDSDGFFSRRLVCRSSDRSYNSTDSSLNINKIHTRKEENEENAISSHDT